jgi:acyl-CoA synthetase (NDP forming)
MSAQGVPHELRSDNSSIPSYAFPEDAAEALARATTYGMWRTAPEGRTVSFPDARRHETAAVIAGALADGPRWLTPQESATVLSCYGIPAAESRFVTTPREAGLAAREIGGRVVLKAIAPDVVHKTEAGAVRLGLEGPTRTERAAKEMRAALEATGSTVTGFMVQAMVEPGVEMIVGVVHDPSFGPVVAVGAGGTAVELVKDVRVGITPLTDLDAAEMIRSLATFPLLTGFRGAPKADVAALEDVLLRVGALVDVHREISEMDLNPVVVHPQGAVTIDARIRVDVPPPQLAVAARRPA